MVKRIIGSSIRYYVKQWESGCSRIGIGSAKLHHMVLKTRKENVLTL